MVKKIFLLLVVVLLLSACDMQMNTGENPDEQPTGCPYDCHSGSSSIDVTIDMPSPSTPESYRYVNNNGKIRPEATLHNNGEADVEFGKVCIAGMSRPTFGFSGCDCQDFTVVVNDPDDPDFWEANVLFNEYTANLADPNEPESTQITFYTRYDYKTYGVFTACVKADGCPIGDNVLDVSSKGPLTITEIIEIPSNSDGSYIDLDFIIGLKTNEGNSEWLLSTEQVNSGMCDIPTESPDVRVKLYMEELSGYIDCGTVTFYENTAQVTCQVDNVPLTFGDNYIERDSQGYIEVEYGYLKTETVEFSVLNS